MLLDSIFRQPNRHCERKRSNPSCGIKKEWIASSQVRLAMTWRDGCAIPRREAPGLCMNLPPHRGRGECRAPAAPAAPCAKGRKHTGRDREYSRKHPAFPHAMVLTAYFALSPVIGLSCHRHLAELPPQDLTPASRRQDHTTSPSAGPRSRQQHRLRPPHPASNVRDDRETPLERRRDRIDIFLFLPGRQAEF